MERGSVAQWRRVVGGALIAGGLAGGPVVRGDQQAPAVTSAAEAGARTRDLAEARLERERAANQRALFASEEPLPFTLIADFKAVNRDRNPDSTKTFPATLV